MAAGGEGSSRAEDFYKRTTLTGGWTPRSPRNNGDFLENYRKTTRKLGKMARANTKKNEGEKRPQVDDETRKIMQRIKLPTYNEAISDAMGQAYMDQYQQNPIATELAFNKASNEWDEDNFYYKLRAAQVLKNMPEERREQYLNNFNISANDAKNELDKVIKDQNDKDIATVKEASSKVTNFLTNLTEAIGKTLGISIKKDGQSNLPSEEERKKMGDITAKDTPGVDADTVPENKTESNEEIIEYTYKPGDTFGQVIKDLGLNTSAGLWGDNGDVEYYAKQLEPQLWDSGVWDRGSRQNIPIGTTIKLKRRPESN